MSFPKKTIAPIRSSAGFSLTELVIYLGILGVVAGIFTSVLGSITKTQVSEFAQNELSGQLNFSTQTIQRLVENSSIIDNPPGVASSTLSLEMPTSSQNPTLIYLQNNQIFLQQGSSTPQALTNERVSVDSLQFNKFSQPGAKDLVQIDVAISQLQPTTGQTLTRSLRSAVSRVSAATFDGDLIPNADNSYNVGTWPTLRWKDAAFSGSVRANNLCFGSDCRSSWAAATGVTGVSPSTNYLTKWYNASSITSSLLYDNGSGVGINVLSPQDLFHIKASSVGQNLFGLEAASPSTSRYDFSVDSSNNLLVKNGSATALTVNTAGQVGINGGIDTNYALTASGVKSTNSSAQPAGYFSNAGAGLSLQTGTGGVLIGSLAGTGSRSVVVDASGNLSATTTSGGSVTGSGATGQVSFWGGATALSGSNNLFWDNTNGRLGVGTATPGQKLSVSGGNIQFDNGYVLTSKDSTGNPLNIAYVNSGTNNLYLGGGYVGNLYLGTGAAGESQIITLLNSGNVGIGTASPGRALDIHAPGTTNQLRISTNSGNEGIEFYDGSGGYPNWQLGAQNLIANAFTITPSTSIGGTLYTTPVVTVLNSGNVGIGTTSPGSKLEVNGTAQIDSVLSCSGTGQAVVTDTTGRLGCGTIAGGITGSGTLNYVPKWTPSGTTLGNSIIYDNGTNVGIGTTNLLTTGGNKLDIGGSLRILNNNYLYGITSGGSTGVIAGITNSDNIQIGQNNINNTALNLYGGTGNTTIFAGPTTVATFTTGGNVGIGTTGPGAKLTVNGDGTVNQISVTNSTTGYGVDLYSSSTGGLINIRNSVGTAVINLDARTGTNVIFNTGGNVGIGTTAPAIGLSVEKDNGNGWSALFRKNSTSNGILIGTPGGISTVAAIDSTLGVYQTLALNPNGGSVGIGTTGPGSTLDVNGTFQIDTQASCTGVGQALKTDTSGRVTCGTVAGGVTPDASQGGSGIGTYVPYWTGATTLSASSSLYVSGGTSGNVGIGTTAPGQKLDVNGIGKFGAYALIGTNISAGYYQDATNGAYRAIVPNTTTNGYYFQTNGGGLTTMYVGLGGTYNGNVGIGTTSPTTNLQVVGTGDVSGALGVGSIVPHTGTLILNSNAAGNAIAFQIAGVEKMRVDTTGNVGIGTASPNYTLQVNGSLHTTAASTGNLGSTTYDLAGNSIGSQTLYSYGAICAGNGSGQCNSSGGVEMSAGGTVGTPLTSIPTSGNTYFNNGSSVGIGTATPGSTLDVNGTFQIDTQASCTGVGQALKTDTSGRVTCGTVAGGVTGSGTVNYFPFWTSASSLSSTSTIYQSGANIGINGSLTTTLTFVSGLGSAINAGGNNVVGINKLNAATIDPLYDIGGTKYATYASSIAGGVKEEYVGRGELAPRNTDQGVSSTEKTYSFTIDFNNVLQGSDLWVWRKAIDFSPDTVEVLATPIGIPAPIAYTVENNKIIFTAISNDQSLITKGKGIAFSYRLVGKRFDWQQWPTKAINQNESAGLVVPQN